MAKGRIVVYRGARGVRYKVRVPAGTDAATGKRRPDLCRTFDQKKDAERWLADALGRVNRREIASAGKLLVGQYLDDWTASLNNVRPRTAAGYEEVVRLYLKPALGSYRLAELAPAHLLTLYNDLTKRGLSPRTVRKAHTVLHTALEDACSPERRLLAVNPAKQIGRRRLPKQPRRDRPALDSEAFTKFLSAVDGSPHKALYVTQATTGLRPAELLGLCWPDIDFKNRTLAVRRVWNVGVLKRGGEARFEEPKTEKSRRVVPLPPSLVTVLQHHRTEQKKVRLATGEAWQTTEYADRVFANSVGGPLRTDNVNRRLKTVLKRASLPKHTRLYDLRHSFASLCGEKGIPLKVVSELMGHSSITLTADTYSHVFSSMKEEAATKLEALFG